MVQTESNSALDRGDAAPDFELPGTDGATYALARARAATLAFLVSLIVGALRAPLVETTQILAESGESWRAAAPRFALAALVGAGAVLVLDRYSAAIEY